MTQPIVMTLREGKDGIDIAEAEFAGQRFTASSRNGVSMKLARRLVEAGAPDAPVEARGRDGRMRFTSPSLHCLAGWTISEPDAGALYLRRYRDRPEFLGGEAQDGVSGAEAPEHAPTEEAA